MASPFGNDGTPTVWNTSTGEKRYPANVFEDEGDHLNNIPWEHAYLHGGTVFRVCDIDEALANNGTLDYVITMGPTLNAHLVFAGACAVDSAIRLHEAVTGVVGGTAVVPYNRNRESSTVSTVGVLLNPTSVTIPGTRPLEGLYLPGAGPQSSGYAAQARGEWILKRNTVYLLRLSNLAGTPNVTASLSAEWYEHLPVGV